MLTIACVQVGNYCGRGREYVERLRDGVSRNLERPHRFACLSDDPTPIPGVFVLPAAPRLPGWWQKLALFEPGRFDGRVLYLDLDTVVEGSLERLAGYVGRFAMISDLWSPTRVNSGLMAWAAGAGNPIWEAFRAKGIPHGNRYGDGGFIAGVMEAAEVRIDRLQSVEPGIYSWKSAQGKAPRWAPPPPAERVVCCFHGQPRPHEVGAWAR